MLTIENYNVIPSELEYLPSDNSILKIIIIHNSVCISYAGTVQFANDALKEIFKLNFFNIKELSDILLKYNKKSNKKPNEKTQFGLAVIFKTGEIKQLKRIEFLISQIHYCG